MTDIERYWLKGWVLATKSFRRMAERDVAAWLALLKVIPIQDAETKGMMAALEAAGAKVDAPLPPCPKGVEC